MAAKLPYSSVMPETNQVIGMTEEEKKCMLKNNIRKTLRVLDEQNAVSGRYVWYNLPPGITSELLERIIYYRGQVAFFFMEDLGQFFVLPYALDGTLDCYGRYNGITPLPFLGENKAKDDKGKEKAWIPGFTLKPQYHIPYNLNKDILTHGCVIIRDYTPQASETITPRQVLNEPILDAMAEAFPLARTSLIAHSGVKGMRVPDEDSEANVKLASRAITKAAMTGDPWVPIVGTIDFQDLTDGGTHNTQEYLLYMQSLDNFRLSLYGLSNGGLFQKKSHMLEAEQKMNQGQCSCALTDGLKLRQDAATIINSIWGLDIWVEVSETALNLDTNGDAVASDSRTIEHINENQGGIEQDE